MMKKLPQTSKSCLGWAASSFVHGMNGFWGSLTSKSSVADTLLLSASLLFEDYFPSELESL